MIGNPPYIEFKNLNKEIKDSLLNIYSTTKGKYDIYIPFFELAHNILKPKGFVHFICPTRFMQRDYGTSLRNFIVSNFKVKEIVDFGDKQNFESAITYTGIFSFSKLKCTLEYDFVNKNSLNDELIISAHKLKDSEWYFHNSEHSHIISKIKVETTSLRDLLTGIFQGIATGKDNVFVVKKECVESNNLEKKYLVKFIKGKDISPYVIDWKDLYCIYPYDDNGKVISEDILRATSPQLYDYLLKNKENLTGRGYFEKSNKLWFELWNQRNKKRFSVDKIVTLDNASKNSFALDCNGLMGTTTTYSLVPLKTTNIFSLLAILNSKVLDFYHKKNTIPQAGGFYRYQAIFIESLPISKKYNNEKLEVLSKEMIKAKTANLETQNIENQINLLVYKIYNLTYDEVKIITPDFSLSEQEYIEFKI